MRSVIKWAVQNSPAVNTLMIGILLIGAGSFWAMRREAFPEFELEILLITVPYPGATPDEVEQGICQKIEEAVAAVDGIKKLTAVSQEGAGYVVLELETYVDVQKTLNEVRSEVDRIPSFPELAEDPEIEQITFRETAINVGVIGPPGDSVESELALREVAEDVRDRLLLLPAISQADIVGTRPYQIDIEVSERRLREYGLTLQQVANVVRRENLELPGGSMRTNTQEVLLRGKNKRLIGTEIANIPLVTQEDGVVLTIGELGRVQDAFEDVAAFNEIDGQPGMVISVQRTRNEDLLRVVDAAKSLVATAELPEGYALKTWADSSVDVRDRMYLLAKNGLQGLALVFLMLAIFLDLRLSFWVAMGIPIAIFGAGAFLLYAGHTLNMLSMFAFLMALGIVVDDAIVIGENIYMHRQRGVPPIRAAVQGTVEVFPSVAASVSTTIIAFTPLLFVSGVMGKFIAIMPVAVIAMLVISLVESSIILPCHLAHSGGDNFVLRRMRRYANGSLGSQILVSLVVATVVAACVYFLTIPSQTLPHPLLKPLAITGLVVCFIPMVLSLSYPLIRFAGFIAWIRGLTSRLLDFLINRTYAPVVAWGIRRPLMVICCCWAVFFASLSLVILGITPFIIFPKMDSNQIEARITYPDGTPSHITNTATERLQAAMDRVNDRYVATNGESLIKTRRRSVGQVRNPQAFGSQSRLNGSHLGSVEVELQPSGHREVTSQAILEQWRKEAGTFAGAESVVFMAPEMGPGGAAIEFKLLADKEHMSQLETAAERCKEQLAKYAGIVDIRDDSRPGKWEYQITVKDKAKAMGISQAQLAETVRAAYYGEEVMRLQRGRHEVKLMVRYPEDERRSLRNFDEIRVRTLDGAEYPLTELARIDVERGFSEINRVDQLRSITITADVEEMVGNARNTVRDMKANYMDGLLAEFPNVVVRWEGQQEQTNDSVSSMLIGFAVAIVAMFALLTVEFRSYLQPIIILGIIPFGIVGAILGHAVMGLPLTIFTLFGLVALTGVVVNDSIVLIDHINKQIRSGVPVLRALEESGRRRFRPVLLTSVTTIAGLTPMLTETSFQAQFLIPLATTLVFGLLVATGLILVLNPAYYALYYRLAGQYHAPGQELDEPEIRDEPGRQTQPSVELRPAPVEPLYVADRVLKRPEQ